MKATALCLSPFFVLTLLLAGCLSAAPRAQQRAAAQKRTFLPVAAAPATPAAAPRFAPIKIRGFRALQPFDSCAFVVRRAGNEFATDFYNAWLVPPQDLIRVQTSRYLEQAGLFSAVYDASSGTLPPLSLEGVISELYLDYAEATPAAVVTLRLLVLDERAPAFTVLFSGRKPAARRSTPPTRPRPPKRSARRSRRPSPRFHTRSRTPSWAAPTLKNSTGDLLQKRKTRHAYARSGRLATPP